MPVTRHGETKTVANPDRRITDFLCSVTKMTPEQMQRAAVRFAEKDPAGAHALLGALNEALS